MEYGVLHVFVSCTQGKAFFLYKFDEKNLLKLPPRQAVWREILEGF